MPPEVAQRRAALAALGFGGAFLAAWLGALAFGSWSALLAHPARAVALALGFVFTFAALASPVNLSRGEREDTRDRRLLVPAAAGTLLLLWLVPYLDRRDLLTLDGDAVRYLGLVLLVVGGVLRIWPMFVLGRRFSAFVAIQPGHELETAGPYRRIRHPSYLGGMIAFVGWVLVFRSGVGLLAAVLAIPLLIERINAEETLLADHFGSAYEGYRRRTKRLIPGLY